MLKLDDRDIEILRILSRNGRISKAELAKRINLSPTPCWERLKRLEKAGVIAGFHADIALAKIAPHIVLFVTVELERHKSGDFQGFERAVARQPEITGCWSLGGGFDYLFKVVARDIDAYQRMMDEMLERGLGLSRYYSYIVTKTVKAGAAPPFEKLLKNAEG